MDLNQLLDRHQRALMNLDNAATDEERAAHAQFAEDYAAQILTVRNKRGPENANCGLPR